MCLGLWSKAYNSGSVLCAAPVTSGKIKKTLNGLTLSSHPILFILIRSPGQTVTPLPLSKGTRHCCCLSLPTCRIVQISQSRCAVRSGAVHPVGATKPAFHSSSLCSQEQPHVALCVRQYLLSWTVSSCD